MINEKLLVLAILAFSVGSRAETMTGDVSPVNSKVQVEEKTEEFESTYRSKGPVHIYFSYNGTDGTSYNQKLNQLTLVTEGRVVGTNVAGAALLVGLSILGGGVFVDTTVFAGKESFVGSRIEGVTNRAKLENPALNIIPRMLDERVTQYIQADESLKDQKNYSFIQVSPGNWTLFYDNSNEGVAEPDRSYYLRFDASITRVLGRRNFFNTRAKAAGVYCSFKSPTRKISEWKTDDYALVELTRNEVVKNCLDKVEASIPSLLGVTDKAAPLSDQMYGAALHCKTNYSSCVSQARNSDSKDAGLAQCKSARNTCFDQEYKPLKALTPVGQCKPKLKECREAVLKNEEGRVIDKEAYKTCTKEYEVCVDRAEDIQKQKEK